MMPDDISESFNDDSIDENAFIQREKRKSHRQNTRAYFSMSINSSMLEGLGANISESGGYFVTCDEIPVDLKIKSRNKEKQVFAKIVRIDRISEGSLGIALQFESRMLDSDI